MSIRLNHEAFGTYNTTTNERKGTLYSTGPGSSIRPGSFVSHVVATLIKDHGLLI
jgi:hypothetical protein